MKGLTLRQAGGARCLAALASAIFFACGGGTAAAQTAFVDDAHRSVTLPDRVSRVFAAGAPAEVLLYTLVPEMLVGRNHAPSPAARELTPPEYRTPAQITNLPDRDDPRYDGEFLALKPDIYVDYGDLDNDYVLALEAITSRTRIPGIILDGRITSIPMTYRKLGTVLGVPDRGERLATEAERIIGKYRGTLAASPIKAYLACSQNGLSPCLAGHSFGEAAELLGAENVAGSTENAPRRLLAVEEIRALAPSVIIAASKASAATLRADRAWGAIPAVATGRVHGPPDDPFNWGPRPPSVNRLLGLIWMAYVLPARPFDEMFFADLQSFFETFYHVTPTAGQLRSLVASE